MVLIKARILFFRYMKNPAARNCMWRFGFKNPKNYDDTGLYCGSFGTQWEKNHGIVTYTTYHELKLTYLFKYLSK